MILEHVRWMEDAGFRIWERDDANYIFDLRCNMRLVMIDCFTAIVLSEYVGE